MAKQSIDERFPRIARKPSLKASGIDIPKIAKDVKKFVFSASRDLFTTFSNGVRFYPLSGPIVPNETTTDAPAGSIGVTSDPTGCGLALRSDGTKWQTAVSGARVKASAAAVDAGSDDTMFITPKVLTDSRVFFLPSSLPEVSPAPSLQDIADELVALGLVTQAQ